MSELLHHDELRSPFFAPRLLGATAPAHPEVFEVDASSGDPQRHIQDENFVDQLELLMRAGLEVDLSGL